MASLDKKLQTVEELLTQIEHLLDELLGEEPQEVHLQEQSEHQELFEIFAETLSLLKEREEQILKSPPSRWKILQNSQEIDWNKLTIADLLSLYRAYSENHRQTSPVTIDDSFEKILLQRREEIRTFIENHPGRIITMERFFQNCRTRQTIIATFLVLLDLVFRRELKMVEENDGRFYFEKNRIIENLEKPS